MENLIFHSKLAYIPSKIASFQLKLSNNLKREVRVRSPTLETIVKIYIENQILLLNFLLFSLFHRFVEGWDPFPLSFSDWVEGDADGTNNLDTIGYNKLDTMISYRKIRCICKYIWMKQII